MNNTFINKKIKNEIRLIKAKLSIIEKSENNHFKNFCHDQFKQSRKVKKIIFLAMEEVLQMHNTWQLN